MFQPFKVYNFIDTYLVTELKDLAFKKFTAVVINLGKPKNLDKQLAVIDCLSLAFPKSSLHDKLPR
ncbi:unnamed protein product [Penicillium roqueforti FM164]|uniref:Str. FM013 n=2 Tax=Penicillium TaxID=5073 RepID=A0A0G4PYT7_PENC3|nr:unnamed protein product [Penicillium roqueforti FM164]CRL31524.1 unnamed protein product [Penicillium camemberti]